MLEFQDNQTPSLDAGELDALVLGQDVYKRQDIDSRRGGAYNKTDTDRTNARGERKMTTDMLRCALRGVAAYRPVVDEPVMRLALGVLDKLSAGDGSGAVEDYARLFYALRSAGSRSLGEWLDGRLRDRESPYAALAERGGEDPALEAAARRDIETFTLLAELDWDQVLAEVGLSLIHIYIYLAIRAQNSHTLQPRTGRTIKWVGDTEIKIL